MSKDAKSFFVGSIAFILFAAMRDIIPLHNMEFFAAACVVFVCIAILSYFILNQKKGNEEPLSGKVWSISAIVLLAVWMILFYVNETNAEHALSGSRADTKVFSVPSLDYIDDFGNSRLPFCFTQRTQGKNAETQKEDTCCRCTCIYGGNIHTVLCAQYLS